VRTTFEAAAISELARRTLRSTHVTYKASIDHGIDIDDISTSLSDASAALIIEFKLFEDFDDDISVYLTDTPGGIFSVSEPASMDEVWIPGDITEMWARYLRTMLELARAGYPGCVGCAGPAAEIAWDEVASRSRLA
tara:strand:+ start:51 stop:461 length:411 start_codon:yes stop_codon:yes gene_type:complete